MKDCVAGRTMATCNKVTLVTLATLWWLFGSGCATEPSAKDYPAQKALIVKTKPELLACAVPPLEETKRGTALELLYYKEASILEESFAGTKGSVPKTHHGCRAKVTLREDRVVDVEYRSVPPSWRAYDHCEEIFAKCAQ